MQRAILAALGILIVCLVLGISAASPRHTPKAGGLSQAVVGAGDALYILRAHQSDDPLDFWRCPVAEAVCYGEPLTGLPGAENRARGVFQNGTALVWDGERYIYALVGGFYNQRGRKGFWRYDTCLSQPPGCEQRWYQLADTPGEQGAGDALAFVRLGEHTYLYALIGAATKQRSGAYNGFSRYDVALDAWEELPKPWSCTDDGAALAWDGGRYLYALHGSDCQDHPTQDFVRFDLAAQTPSWEIMPNIPEPVDDGGSLVWDGGEYLYAITGGAGEHGSDGKGFYRFDLQLLRWESLERLPCPVGEWNGNRLAVVEGEVYLWQGSPNTWECGGSAILEYSGWQFGTPPTAPTLESHVVINEFELNPPCDDRYSTCLEWVELYNPTASEINLSGWSLSTRDGETKIIPEQCSSLAPGEYCIVKAPRWLENECESIVLMDAAGNEVDRTIVACDTANDDRSWQRCPDGWDTDSDADWRFRTSTPGENNNC